MKRPHIGIVTGLLHPRYGGPFSVVRTHAEALRAHADVTVFGVAPAELVDEAAAALPGAHVFPLCSPERWFRGRGLYDALKAAADGIDAWHAHMLWDHPVWAAAQIAKATDRPLVIRPAGSLSAVWRRRAPHKRLYRRMVLDRVLGPRVALHALNDAEAAACRAWAPQMKVVTIPNGLPKARFDEVGDPGLALERWPQLKGRRVALFLGRLWGEKGLDHLPEAWAAGAADDWTLVIAGPDYRGYQAGLERRLSALGLGSDRVLLTGSVAGALKWSLLAAASLFLLPSKSEGFSVALLEAMASGTPALYTHTCNLPELAQARGGWAIERGIEPLTDGLKAACGRSPERLRAAGERARALGRSAYTAEGVAESLIALYDSI